MTKGYPKDLRNAAPGGSTYTYKLNPDGTKGKLVKVEPETYLNKPSKFNLPRKQTGGMMYNG